MAENLENTEAVRSASSLPEPSGRSASSLPEPSGRSSSSLPLAIGLMMASYSALSVAQYHAVLFRFTHGLTEAQIGTAFMLGSLTYVAAPLITAGAQSLGLSPRRLLTLALAIAATALALLPRLTGVLAPTLGYVAFQLSGSMAITLVIASVLGLTRGPGQEKRFYFVRALGTAAFAGTCMVNAILARWLALPQLYWVFVTAASVALLLSLRLPRGEARPLHLSHLPELAGKLKPLLPLTLLVMLANMAFFVGEFYSGVYLRTVHGGSDAQVSQLWTIATVMEVPLILGSVYVLRALSFQWLFAIGMLATATKLLLTAASDGFAMQAFAQLFHGFWPGASITAIPLLLQRVVHDDEIPLAALSLSALYTGLGAATAGKVAGSMWHSLGLPMTFAIWGGVALLCALVVLRVRLPAASAPAAAEATS